MSLSAHSAGGNPSSGSGHSPNGRSGKTRFKGSVCCPICGGAEDDKRGEGSRCWGFLSGDGKWAHCTREEFAGRQVVKGGSGTYAHAVKGRCPCGVEHAPADDPRPRRPKAKAKFERAYPYHNASGELVFKVLRYRDPRGFKQCREVDGKTVWNLDGVERIPYRLPELVANANADPTRQVFIAEGEKDVDALVERGLLATCNPGGAGKWRDSYSDYVAGRAIVIIPDNDQVGLKHADDVARSVWGKAASVKIVTIPDHKDVSDYFAAGGTVDALKVIVKDSPPWKPPPSNGKPAGKLRRFNRTDLGNAERLVAQHGSDIRYCHPWKKWLDWDGRRWAIDRTGAPRRRARQTARSIYKEVANETDDEKRKQILGHAVRSEKRERLSAMLQLAEAELGIPILPEDMDTDPWAFNCLNGTIDLRTGELRPHRRSDYITKLCQLNYDPNAICPLWDKTLKTFLVKPELIAYVQRICGCTTVGLVRDHILPVFYGKGSNGKSTLLGALIAAFGPDYAMKCQPDMLMLKKTDSHPTDRADLFGKRLAVAIETESGRRLNETMIKELTGGDPIRTRRMREDPWEFKPSHTVIMATNHKPVIRGTDEGIWRRPKIVPFLVSLSDDEADKAMPEKLQAELPGILAWCVRGCLAWQKEGLDTPPEVIEATAEYREEQDIIGAFLAEHTMPGAKWDFLKAGELYRLYVAWAETGNEFKLTLTAFGMAMRDRGSPSDKKSGVKKYFGLRFKTDEDRAKEEEGLAGHGLTDQEGGEA